jgi:phosphate transport system substrate-binding protein
MRALQRIAVTTRTALLLPAVVMVALGPAISLATAQPFSEQITIDGSSTLFPVSEVVADEFQLAHPTVRVTVGISGTREGFEKLLSGSADINDASRPITKEEQENARRHGLGYIELPVALDGISVVVNPENDWVDHLSIAELRRLWGAGGGVIRWSDLRPGWPERPIHLYAPGRDSGTYEYFSEEILRGFDVPRHDYTDSENDTVLVQGIGNDRDALGYFGYGYYERNRARIKLVPIETRNGAVRPSRAAIASGAYEPLVRPLFLYVRSDAAQRPAVKAFVEFYLQHATTLVPEAGYVPLPPRAYELCQQRFERRRSGSAFGTQRTPLWDVLTVLEEDLKS